MADGGPPEDRRDGPPPDFKHWDVTNAAVGATTDLVGPGLPFGGPFTETSVDLDGSVNPPAPTARLESKRTFTLEPGDYQLSFKITSSGAGSNADNTVDVSLGGLYSETFAKTAQNRFEFVVRDIEVTTTTNATLVFDHSVTPNDFNGIFLNDVILRRVTDSGLQLKSPDGDFSTLEVGGAHPFTRTLKDGTQIVFDADGFQTQVVDRNGNETDYLYDANDRLMTIRDPVERETSFQYSGSSVTITDPAMRQTVLTLDGANDLRNVVFPGAASPTIRFDYDDRHLLLAETDERGLTSVHTYDDLARVATARPPDASERTVENAQSIGIPDPPGSMSVLRPSAALSTFTDAEGRTTASEIGPHGTLADFTPPDGLPVRLTRDDDGNLTQLTLPSGHTVVAGYDGKGNAVSIEDQVLGGTTELVYDPDFSQVKSIEDSRDKKTILSYSPTGNLENVLSDLPPLYGPTRI